MCCTTWRSFKTSKTILSALNNTSPLYTHKTTIIKDWNTNTIKPIFSEGQTTILVFQFFITFSHVINCFLQKYFFEQNHNLFRSYGDENEKRAVRGFKIWPNFLDLFLTDVCFYGGNDYSQLHRETTTDRSD